MIVGGAIRRGMVAA